MDSDSICELSSELSIWGAISESKAASEEYADRSKSTPESSKS